MVEMTLEGNKLKPLDDFSCLLVSIHSSENDMEIRIKKACATLNKMENGMEVESPKYLKINYFQATLLQAGLSQR